MRTKCVFAGAQSDIDYSINKILQPRLLLLLPCRFCGGELRLLLLLLLCNEKCVLARLCMRLYITSIRANVSRKRAPHIMCKCAIGGLCCCGGGGDGSRGGWVGICLVLAAARI